MKKQNIFTKLKNRLIMDFIEKWIAKLLLAFKAKNPKLWAAVAVVLTVLMFGLQSILPGIQLPDFIPADALSLHWIIETFNLPISEMAAMKIMWFIGLLTGSKGTTAFMRPEKREETIQASQSKIAEIDAKKTGL